MTEWQTPTVVAILNTNDDLVELLRVAFEQAGLIVVSAHIDDLRRGTFDLPSFLRQHDPRVVVYDVPPPYDAHWRFFEHLRHAPDLHGRQFIITSTNVERLYESAGTREPIYELIGKPYDLEQITRAVKEASRARSIGLIKTSGQTSPFSIHGEARDQQSSPRTPAARRQRAQRSRQGKRRPKNS